MEPRAELTPVAHPLELPDMLSCVPSPNEQSRKLLHVLPAPPPRAPSAASVRALTHLQLRACDVPTCLDAAACLADTLHASVVGCPANRKRSVEQAMFGDVDPLKLKRRRFTLTQTREAAIAHTSATLADPADLAARLRDALAAAEKRYEHEQAQSGLLSLPREMVLYIFGWLDDADMASMSAVCKLTHTWLLDPYAWAACYQRESGLANKLAASLSWRDNLALVRRIRADPDGQASAFARAGNVDAVRLAVDAGAVANADLVYAAAEGDVVSLVATYVEFERVPRVHTAERWLTARARLRASLPGWRGATSLPGTVSTLLYLAAGGRGAAVLAYLVGELEQLGDGARLVDIMKLRQLVQGVSMSLLAYAGWKGNAAGVRWLLGRDIHPDSPVSWTAVNNSDTGPSCCALAAAAASGHTDIVRGLIAAGADPAYFVEHSWREHPLSTVRSLRECGWVPCALAAALFHNRVHIAELLLSTPRRATPAEYAGVNIGPLSWGDVPVHTALNLGLVAAADARHLRAVRFALQAGADPRWRDREGETALHAAARTGSPSVIRALLDAGADPDAADSRRSTPASIARRCHHRAAMKLLISQPDTQPARSVGAVDADACPADDVQ